MFDGRKQENFDLIRHQIRRNRAIKREGILLFLFSRLSELIVQTLKDRVGLQ